MGLPDWQPGCGSKSVEPGVHEALIARYGESGLKSREIAVGNWDDPIEACFERGWSDGLPVVPPTDERILRMLGGTHRKPQEVVGLIPPNLAPCTVEINKDGVCNVIDVQRVVNAALGGQCVTQ